MRITASAGSMTASYQAYFKLYIDAADPLKLGLWPSDVVFIVNGDFIEKFGHLTGSAPRSQGTYCIAADTYLMDRGSIPNVPHDSSDAGTFVVIRDPP